MQGVWFHRRLASDTAPAGITVSKHETLPAGEFSATEYCWGSVSLWFVDQDEFTADERQTTYESYALQLSPAFR